MTGDNRGEAKRTTRGRPSRRKLLIAAAIAAAIALLAVITLAAFPVGLIRGAAERGLSSKFDAPVSLGSLSRRETFSFTPTIVIRDLRIGQPAWAGKGGMLKVASASARVPILSLLSGDPAIRSLDVEGLDVSLVRDAEGNSNWGGRAKSDESGDGDAVALDMLAISNGRFTLRDQKRRLQLTGTLEADPRAGLRADASGTFNGSPARATVRGGGPPQKAAPPSWPFSAKLTSDLLDLEAQGTMARALDMRDMQMQVRARGTSLKQLDYIIEAGLFGTQDIDLAGQVRHRGQDWFIDSLAGTIGRSRLSAKAAVLKRGGRTKIDATINATEFDFDDLADDAGLAAARAQEARIGPRIIPDTRINLGKMGPTDGVIRFSIARLLVKGGSVFQSLKGKLTLDQRILKLEDMIAVLDRGRMTGRATVDSRKTVPTFSTDLRVEGASFDTFVGQPDMIQGPVDGLIRINGRGDTIRQAFASGSGKIAFVANGGAMNRAAAFVLGQDLGGAIGQKLGDDEKMVPIRCAIMAFSARGGILTPSPFTIDTAISRGSGRGQIKLDGETVALTLAGSAKEKAALRLVDPLRIGGTLTRPDIGFDQGSKTEGGKRKGLLGTIGRSIGTALGLRKEKDGENPAPSVAAIDCTKLARAALH